MSRDSRPPVRPPVPAHISRSFTRRGQYAERAVTPIGRALRRRAVRASRPRDRHDVAGPGRAPRAYERNTPGQPLTNPALRGTVGALDSCRMGDPARPRSRARRAHGGRPATAIRGSQLSAAIADPHLRPGRKCRHDPGVMSATAPSRRRAPQPGCSGSSGRRPTTHARPMKSRISVGIAGTEDVRPRTEPPRAHRHRSLPGVQHPRQQTATESHVTADTADLAQPIACPC